MKEFVPHLLRFLKNPTEQPGEIQSVSKNIKWLFLALLIDIPVMFILSKLQSIPIRLGFIDTGQHRLVKYFEESNLFILILVVIILAPLIEEAIIRLPLRIKSLNFIPLLFFGILLNGSSLAYRIGEGFSWLVLIPVLLTVVATLFVFNRNLFEKMSGFLRAQYFFYFYLMSAIFALLHLFNFQFNWYVLLFSPLLVLPQFVGGIFMGFIRLKSGFKWGIFLHMLHNALFLLPFYFYINNPQHSFEKLVKDGYQFEVMEGESPKTPGTRMSKITPNEIILEDTFERVISRLTRKDIKEIEFKNNLLAKKRIGLIFKNDSAYFSEKTDSACYYALHNLLNNYNLELKTDKRWASISSLLISDTDLFQRNKSLHLSTESADKIRSFYGSKDTIKLNNVNSKYLTNLIELNFNINVNNQINDSLQFSVNIPNSSPAKLNKYLKQNYGIELKQKRAKIDFLIVEKR